MKDKLLIFSGTSEGRRLAELSADSGIKTTVCVATEYGAEMMTKRSSLEVHKGRLGIDEMSVLMKEGFAAVVDATHPFAVEVSENIKEAAKESGLYRIRLNRDTKIDSCEDVRCFSTHDECAKALLNTEGNILLTTGSKNLKVYCENKSIRDRLYVRVLPNKQSIEACNDWGIKGNRIIAMHGPFSEEMNLAIMRQFKIGIMVTKQSGDAGGFEQKNLAAKRHGAKLYVISNPEQICGMDFDGVCKTIEEITGRKIKNPDGEEKYIGCCVPKTGHLSIALIGAGPGSKDMMTVRGKGYLEKADYVFGAKRLVDGVADMAIMKPGVEIFPFYRAEEIIPVLGKINTLDSLAVILFSGDTGFHSGAWLTYEKLVKWKEEQSDVTIEIFPGISSVSFFAARLGISYQDADVVSVHGRGDSKLWKGEIEYKVRHGRNVFILVSGSDDVQTIGEALYESGLNKCSVIAGSNLTDKNEKIIRMNPCDCREYKEDGPVILAVINDEPEPLYVVPHLIDEGFVRGKAPMTKEEIRDIVLCKLRLTDDAVVYDIGSGTGSVACAIAERSDRIRVYAIEKNEESAELTCRNCERNAPFRIEVVRGMAPDAFSSIPEPSHAFIGGSAGKLFDILSALYAKNSKMRVVMTAVTLETISEMNEIHERMSVEDFEVIQLQISKANKIGEYDMMRAENPVFICSFNFVRCKNKGAVDE